MCQDILEYLQTGPDLLQRVITGDESWIFEYDPEIKRKSLQWKCSLPPKPKKANGIIHDTLSSVDIQEIVKAGGSIIKIYEGIVYEKNLEIYPYKEFVIRLFASRKKYKEEKNKVGDSLVKLLLNSLYGKMIQKDMNTKAHIWNDNTFNNRYDPDLLKKFERINDDQYYVEMKKEITDVIDHSQSNGTTKLLPSHLGVFILSHSKRIMNNFIHSIDAFKK